MPGHTNADAFRRITSGREGAALRLLEAHNHLFQPAATGSISEYERLPPGPDPQDFEGAVADAPGALPQP